MVNAIDLIEGTSKLKCHFRDAYGLCCDPDGDAESCDDVDLCTGKREKKSLPKWAVPKPGL